MCIFKQSDSNIQNYVFKTAHALACLPMTLFIWKKPFTLPFKAGMRVLQKSSCLSFRGEKSRDGNVLSKATTSETRLQLWKFSREEFDTIRQQCTGWWVYLYFVGVDYDGSIVWGNGSAVGFSLRFCHLGLKIWHLAPKTVTSKNHQKLSPTSQFSWEQLSVD